LAKHGSCPSSLAEDQPAQAHTSDQHQGLRRVAGNGKYPLQDSFFQRSFGVGLRHRSPAVALRVTALSVYTLPADSLIFV
jgi:hypothetical protein